MTTTTRRRRRRRLVKLLAPAFFVLYLVMIPLNSVLEDEHSEVFPFFRWKLFANIPDWQTTEYALVIDAVDGQPLDAPLYLIPSPDIRDWKALRTSAVACTKDRACDETVTDILFPIVQQALGDRSIDFSIVEADVDLHDVQDGIDELADGDATRTDFYQPRTVIGQWNTETGRLLSSTRAE